MSKPVAREVEREDVPRPLRRPEDRQPAVADLEGQLDRLRRDRGEVDRDLRAQRPHHQLQRLPEPGAALDRDVVVRSVVLEPLAAKRSRGRSRRTRASSRAASPTPGRASPRRPAAPTSRAPSGSGRPRAGRASTAVIAAFAGDRPGSCMIAVPSLSARRLRAEPGERRDRVDAPRLCRPGRVVPEASPPHARARAARAGSSPAARTPCRSRASSKCDAMGMTTSTLAPPDRTARAGARVHGTTACSRTSTLLDQENDEVGRARRRAARRGARARPLGAARAARGRRHRHRASSTTRT